MKIAYQPINLYNIEKADLSKKDNIQKHANVLFSALPKVEVKNTKNVFKINKLVNNFTKIYMDDLPGLAESKETFFEKFLILSLGGIAKTAMKCKALSVNGVAGILKIDNKDVGGYAFSIDKKNNLGFMMLTSMDKKYHHTRVGNKALIYIAESIYKNAKAKNVSRIAWIVDEENKRGANLFSRFKTNIEKYKSMDVHVIDTEEFGNTIIKYKTLDTKI